MKYKQRNLFYIYLIIFLGFAGFAVFIGINSAPLYKNSYIQKYGEETLAKITDCEYDNGSKIKLYSYTYEYEIGGKTFSGKTSGQYSYINISDDTVLHIKIKYLPNGDSCASDYDKGNDLTEATASYVIATIAIFILYLMLAHIVAVLKTREVLINGKDGKASFIRMDGALQIGKKSYYRIVYGFDFPNKGYREVKTPYMYTNEEVQFVTVGGVVDIKYNHKGTSAVALDIKKFTDSKTK